MSQWIVVGWSYPASCYINPLSFSIFIIETSLYNQKKKIPFKVVDKKNWKNGMDRKSISNNTANVSKSMVKKRKRVGLTALVDIYVYVSSRVVSNKN